MGSSADIIRKRISGSPISPEKAFQCPCNTGIMAGVRTRLSQYDISRIRVRVLRGESYSQIARDYGVTPGAVCQRMSALRLNRKAGGGDYLKKWDGHAIDVFLSRKKSTVMRASQPARNVKVAMSWKCGLCGGEWDQCFNSIQQHMKNGSVRGCPECGWGKSTVYHGLMDSMTPLSAYFLGAFAARGSVAKLSKGDSVTLTSDDPQRIRSLARAISYDGKINPKNNSITFRSSRIAKALRRAPDGFGKILSSPLAPHFVRGYFDYQGHVERLAYASNPQFRATFTGTRPLVSGVMASYRRQNGADDGYLRKNSKTRNRMEFQVVGLRSPLRFMSWIYNHNVSSIKYADEEKYGFWLHMREAARRKSERRAEISALQWEYAGLVKTRKRLGLAVLSERTGLGQTKIFHLLRDPNCRIPLVKHAAFKIAEIESRIAKIRRAMPSYGLTQSALNYRPVKLR